MGWHLQPLHAVSEPPVALPREGSISVGRRPGNQVLCKDLAVSGQHCIFHCRGNTVAEPPEVEDCSTNGSYVNDTKITKGQRQQLAVGDVVSLTKPPEENDAPHRVQFRLDFHERTDAKPLESFTRTRVGETLGGRSQLVRQAGEVPPTAPDPNPAPCIDLGAAAGEGHCFAQDLLVQEQQSKAKITAQLLQSQGKLEEERQAAESASRELDKVRKQVAEERARRHEAEENRDRLTAEAETLRTERRQLQELRAAHEELRKRHEAVQLELQAKLQNCSQLETVQEQLRKDLEKALEGHQKASQQHAELQTRSRQAQERSDRLEQQYAEAKREADWAQEEGNRLQNELTSERSAREKLEEQVAQTKEQVAKAEASEKAAREAMDAATAKLAELKCQASAAHADLEGARAAAKQAQQRLAASKQLVGRLQEAGQSLSAELKRRAEIWEKALADGNFSGLEEAMTSGGPTFAQVTCQVETPPTKSQHDEDRNGDAGQVQISDNIEAERLQATTAGGQVNGQSTPILDAAAVATAAVDPAEAPKTENASREDAKVVEVSIDDDEEDDLLAAAVRDPPGEAPDAARHWEPAMNATGTAEAATAAALPACSTTWSLEVLDAAPGFSSREAMDHRQPAKRQRLNGEGVLGDALKWGQ